MPKITELNAITTVANNDLLMVVHDPSGLPSTNKITVNNFISSVGTQLRGYTGSVGAASAIGYTGSVGTGYAGSAGPAGTSGFTGSAGTGYTGSAGVGYAGSAGDSINSAQGNNGFLPVSTGSNTYTWKANPDVRSYKEIFNNYQATLDDSVLTVDPSVNLSSITIFLPNTAPDGKVFGVENKYNFGGESYIVMVKKTDLSNTVQHPVTGQYVSTVSMPYSNEGYFWIYENGNYRILHNMHNSDVFYSSANNYSEVAIQNINSGVEASADLVIYNDLGDYDVGNGPFIDLGLNSSQYNTSVFGSIWEPNDGYLYNSGGTLLIGTAEDNSIKVFAGNTNAENVLLTINTNAIHSNTSFIPSQNNIFSLGSANKQWKELWVSNNTIYIGGVPVTVSGGLLSVNGSISTGYTGSAGSSGTIGYTGSEGAAGTNGYTGSAGAAGYTGSSGLVGYAGSNGTAGYTGSEGAAGSPGSVGYTGSEGPTGFTGSQGDPLSSANFLFTSSNNSIELNGANTLYIVDNWSSGLELISNTSVQLTWAYSVDSVGYSGNTGYFYINGSGAYVDFYDGVTSKTWNFASNGDLVFPDNTSQNTAFTNSKTLTTISSAGPTTITNDVTFADPNAAGANVNLILPSSPISGKVYTVKNINAGGKVVYVQTDGTDSMENESGSIGSGVYATISTTGSRITWIYDAGSTTYRIID